MSRIYTRGGDQGFTRLADGRRVPKSDPRVAAYGALDEATSWIGVALVACEDPDFRRALEFVQQKLYVAAAWVAGARGETCRLRRDDTAFLEASIDAYETCTGPLTHFILPGGTELAARLHMARTVVRRAETLLVVLPHETEEDREILDAFLNRLSDFLFAAARFANCRAGVVESAFDSQTQIPAVPKH